MIRKKSTTSRLRHLLKLQNEIKTLDSAGGYVRSWEDVASLWAEISPVSGREYLYGGQLESKVTHKITLRYRDGIMAGQRLVFENRAFNIRHVYDMEENKTLLQILAEEGVAS